MTNFLMHALLGVLIWGMLAVTAYVGLNPRTTGLYDCSLASFHPDYPVSVRQKCREVKR